MANEQGAGASGYARSVVGWVEAIQGDATKGLKEIQRGPSRDGGSRRQSRTLHGPSHALVESHLRTARSRRARVAIEDASRRRGRNWRHTPGPRFDRLEGELRLARTVAAEPRLNRLFALRSRWRAETERDGGSARDNEPRAAARETRRP